MKQTVSNVRRIDLRGVILDSSYDFEWLKPYIEKGVFTPESRIRAQLKDAELAGDSIELFISSPGGSVVAGGEILNAYNAYPHAKKIVVGAYAASMAAVIALQGASDVVAHSNSLFLFHGAWNVIMGGAGASEDNATLLKQINEPIKMALAAKNVPQEMIDSGFGEGRQLTMNAIEALKYGLISSIIDSKAAPIARLAKEEEDDLLAAGCPENLAACAMQNMEQDVETVEKNEEIKEEEIIETAESTVAEIPETILADDQKESETVQNDENSAVLDEKVVLEIPEPVAIKKVVDSAAKNIETIEARLGRLEAELAGSKNDNRAIQSAKDREVSTLKAQIETMNNLYQKNIEGLKAEYDAYRVASESAANSTSLQISELSENLNKAREQHRAVTGAALIDQNKGAETLSWPEAVKRHGQNARNLFPQLASEYRKTHSVELGVR